MVDYACYDQKEQLAIFWFLLYTSASFFLIGCPPIKLIEGQPRNFTVVESYNTTLKYSFDGYYQLLKMWVLLPHSQTPELLDDQRCWVKHPVACSDGTDLSYCCRFEFTMHSITSPYINESGTAFSYSKNFTNEDTVWMSK